MRAAALLFALLALAACNTASSATPTPITPTPRPTLSATPQPLAVNLTDIAPGTFRARYNDPVTGLPTTVSGNADYGRVANLTGFSINFVPDDPTLENNIIFLALPPDTEPGTYKLWNYDDSFDPLGLIVEVTGAVITLGDYIVVDDGVLTLDSVEPLTGAFRFTGQVEIAAGQVVTVLVEGAFNQIPFIRIG